MFKRRSNWLQGVMHAELLGAQTTQERIQHNRHAEDNTDYREGVMDYLNHYKNRILPIGEQP